MNKNVEFLDYIYQNAEMGCIGIDHIIDKIENEDLEKLIMEQRKEYKCICHMAKDIYKKYGKEEKDISKVAKVSSGLTADMKMLKSKNTESTIAKMMIEGSNKGIIEITEKLNQFKNADKEIIDLANKLLKTEQHNLDELKKYL